MKARTTALLTCCAALAGPAAADAAVSEIGTFAAAQQPSCPAKPCYVLNQTTAFQAKEGTNRSVVVAPADGRVVAWTVRLAKMTTKQTQFFDTNLGGPASAQLTIVRPGPKLSFRILAQGEPQLLEPYFGQTVQFPLAATIPVKKGNVVALTATTWAPVLALGQPPTTSWRASRQAGACDPPNPDTAQTRVNNIRRFACLYQGVRLTYSATFVPDPVPNAGSKSTTVKNPSTSGTTTKPKAG